MQGAGNSRCIPLNPTLWRAPGAELALAGGMRIGVAILTSGLLIGCGLGYQNSQIDRRPEQAYGVGATHHQPGRGLPGDADVPGLRGQ